MSSTLTSSGPWPCPVCPVKGPTFCRAIAPDDTLTGKLRNADIRQSCFTAAAGRLVYRPGNFADDLHVLCEGWAFTFSRLPDGRRQIFSFLLPGDIFSSRMVFGTEDYLLVASVTEAQFRRINSANLQREIMRNPELLKNATGVYAHEMQHALETAVDLGQRSADERIANFIVRLTDRLFLIGVGGKAGRFPFPIRQSEIADAVGLTPVHVSRVMTKFRKEELIDVLWGELVIKDRLELKQRAGIS